MPVDNLEKDAIVRLMMQSADTGFEETTRTHVALLDLASGPLRAAGSTAFEAAERLWVSTVEAPASERLPLLLRELQTLQSRKVEVKRQSSNEDSGIGVNVGAAAHWAVKVSSDRRGLSQMRFVADVLAKQAERFDRQLRGGTASLLEVDDTVERELVLRFGAPREKLSGKWCQILAPNVSAFLRFLADEVSASVPKLAAGLLVSGLLEDPA